MAFCQKAFLAIPASKMFELDAFATILGRFFCARAKKWLPCHWHGSPEGNWWVRSVSIYGQPWDNLGCELKAELDFSLRGASFFFAGEHWNYLSCRRRIPRSTRQRINYCILKTFLTRFVKRYILIQYVQILLGTVPKFLSSINKNQ